MTPGTPWSVKGIDPKAREVAKDLARRSGMTLGEWLNRMILEDDSPEDVTSEAFFGERGQRPYVESPRPAPAAPARYEALAHPGDEMARVAAALDRLTARIEASEGRTGSAIGVVEQSVRDAVSRLSAAERDQVAIAARFEGAVDEVRTDQSRMVDQMRRLEQQQGAAPRSAEALRALEQAIGKVATHLYEGENRTRDALTEVEGRMARIEAGQGEAPNLVEEVVHRVGERLAEAQARTGDALDALRVSLAALDGRLSSVEASGGESLEHRLESLGAALTERIEAARNEVAARLSESAEGRFDRVERKLGEMAQHVQAAEQRSAQAIERMGQEVVVIAETLTRRVQAGEQRNAEAIEQVGGEMARVAQTVDARLTQGEAVQAQALEKLGGEIARITERLSERIANAERRSAQAIDDVGEQVVRVSERIAERTERASEELADRIRQSEERTARLLEEARERIDQRLTEHNRRNAEAVRTAALPAAEPVIDEAVFEPARFPGFPQTLAEPAPAAIAAAVEHDEDILRADDDARDRDDAPFSGSDFAASLFAPRTPAEVADQDDADENDRALDLDDFEPAAEFKADDGFADDEKFDADDAFEPDDAFAPAAEFARHDEPARGLFEDEQDQEDDRPLVAEAAAEAAAEDDAFEPAIYQAPHFGVRPSQPEPLDSLDDLDILAGPKASEPVRPAEPESFEPQERPLSTRELIEQARAAARAPSAGDARAKLFPRARTASEHAPEREAKPARSLFQAFGGGKRRAGGGATLSTAILFAGGAAALGVAATGVVMLTGQPSGQAPDRVARAIAADKTDGALAATETPTQARAAVAMEPKLLSEASAEQADQLEPLFREAVDALEANDASGLDKLRRAANLGYAPAQSYLAELHQTGGSGVKRDPVEARRWAERAAQGGDRKAMHNLALYLFEGVGGGKNAATAAQWFRRAAELGLVDSQYNLAQLYEHGSGVNQNPAEAYKWYLIAARSGDGESRNSAERLRAQLSADARLVAERAAQSFRAGASAQAAAAPQPASEAVGTAQRALSRLGYYQGPTDGVSTPALRLAVAAYQRDQGITATGAVDPATLSKLAMFTR